MKKYILIILIILMSPLTVLAVEDVDYEISAYKIDAQIKDNGNVDVCEYIKQTGSFNGYVREIFYKGGDTFYSPKNISNLTVYDLNTVNMTKGKTFQYAISPKKGDNLKYKTDKDASGLTVTMYNANNYGSKGYVLCYTLEDAILVHNDVAELYYSFIPDGFEDRLNNADVKVSLPKKDDTLRVWAHGELYGNVSNVENKMLHASITHVNPGEKVAIRMTFNKNQVSKSTRLTNKNALDEIIEEENKFAQKANFERNLNKLIINFVYIYNTLFLLYIIYSVVKHYIKYDKEYKVEFNMEYFRDFPAEYGPETLEYLIKKNNTTESYSASILNMIYKKSLNVQYNEQNKDYVLTKNEESISKLTILEKGIFDFLIYEIGDGESVTLKEIKKYGKNESTANEFLNNFNNWKHNVKKDSEQYNFFENNKNKTKIIIIIVSIINFILGQLFDSSLTMTMSFLGMLASVYLTKSHKKTKNGALEYTKWMAFKKFLVDFGRFDEKELPEIILWEKYLVYATVLGVADKLEKTMKIKIENYGNTSDIDIFTMNYMLRHDFATTMNRSISNAYTTSRSTIAASSASSGSGGGGGFSGGGGGGGGGGGHGF